MNSALRVLERLWCAYVRILVQRLQPERLGEQVAIAAPARPAETQDVPSPLWLRTLNRVLV